jgi:two-component system sensor histidine kinase DesK
MTAVGGGPTLARAVVFVVMIGFCVVAFVSIVQHDVSGLSLVSCLVYMLGILGLQTLYFIRPDVGSSPYRYVALLAEAALVYLPLLQFQQGWIALPGFLAGTVLIVLPRALAWPAFAAIVASVGLIQNSYTGVPYDIIYSVVSTVITGGVIFGLTRLSSLLDEVSLARLELASLAVKAERARFSQDVHDLLGFELSAIGLKAELAQRLLEGESPAVRDQLGEIRDLSRHASEDLRAVARGHRPLSLATETRMVRVVLTAAGIEASVSIDCDIDSVPEDTATALALILREGVTNVIRHSQAERCEVILGQDRQGLTIEIVNDGLFPGSLAAGGGSRNGLANLEGRAESLGGTFHAGTVDGQTFALRATIPFVAGATVPVHGVVPRSPQWVAAETIQLRPGLGQVVQSQPES